MTTEEIKKKIAAAVQQVRATTPLVPSITNTVTINLVANAQLAVGGSAAMVYMPDEGEAMAEIGQAMYLNVGTMSTIYAETMPRTVRALAAHGKPWVLDPVAVGRGSLRMELVRQFRSFPPTIVRGNASEIITLASTWGLESSSDGAGVRGVDSTDTVAAAEQAARAIASFIGGAVAVSGEVDLVTDGEHVALSYGGSELFTRITGAGCSLGGVTAVYAAVAEPFIAALTAVQMYNLAGARAAAASQGPGSFERALRDELYLATPADVAANLFTLK